MRQEAVTATLYYSPGWNQDYPRRQVLTVNELLHGAEVKMPPTYGTFKEAQRVRQAEAGQTAFELD